MAAFFPPFFRAMAVRAGMGEAQATAYWGYTSALALGIVAVLAPVLGAIADHAGQKKRFMACCVGLGVVASAAAAFLGDGAWRTAALVFVAGNIGFAAANVFYESFLPHITDHASIDRVSARGFAFGYVGGGLLLVVNALWVLKPHLFGMADTAVAVRASFLSVAVWWGVFSVPLFRHVPEPGPAGMRGGARSAVAAGVRRLGETFREIRRYRQVVLFLVAFWIYNDGISTIIKMATAYGSEIGIELHHMILALVITQFIGIPCTLGFGRLAGVIGTRRTILLTLGIYVLISVGAFFMATPVHFYILAALVGTVQGGSQALSRSLFGRMVPKDRAAEFFGFYSASAKFAGIAGPLVFAMVSQAVGASRWGILSLVVFFVLGGAVLLCVDERLAGTPRPTGPADG